VRAALGAERSGIVLLTLGRAVPILLAGTAAGLVLAYALSGFLEAQLVEVAPRDPATYFASGGLLAAVALLAALIPSWRAARLDPVEVLRRS
jgi:ABC-type antimicrobial peptide transport system permease subunit